jgi:ABC-2 type transport system ATP-binding protein
MDLFKAIETKDLTKYYGDFLAVDHINFDVEKGEIFGFLGPNGAGKSTTIRMLTGISTPTEGTASIMGFNIVKQSVKAKSIMGIVPDISNIYTELSAWENLLFTGKLYGVNKKRREERSKELLKFFGLYERRHEKVIGFSRGMRRRVCIAMALVHDSQILYLDEPTSGLDVKSVRNIQSIIKDFNEDGLTIFLTTHNIEESSQLCDRIAIINRGKIRVIDTPERIKRAMKSSQSIEIGLDKTGKEIQETFRNLESVSEIQKRGDKLRVYTDNPDLTVKQIVKIVEKNGLELVTLNTMDPSLEDAFLKLTGDEMENEVIKRRGKRR